VRRADDNVGDGWRDANLNAGVALLSEFALEELVQLGVEDTVGNELAALGNVDAAHALCGRFGFLHAGRVTRSVLVEVWFCRRSISESLATPEERDLSDTTETVLLPANVLSSPPPLPLLAICLQYATIQP